MEPPNPVAATMDTGLHRGQGEFIKGASQLTPGCGGIFFQLAPSGIPPADPALRAGPAARIPGDADQPGGEHQHRRHPLLAAQRLSSGRHPAGSVSPQAVGLRRCLGDDPGASGGANPVKVVPLRLESRG